MINCRFFNHKTFIALLLYSLFSQTVCALIKQDFAYSVDINQGKQSLRQFELPLFILNKIKRQDYGDLRIFNRKNQSIPFKISINTTQIEPHISEHKLDFFTLPKNPQKTTHLLVEFDRYNHWLTVNQSRRPTIKPSYIIIKNQTTDKQLTKLKLYWNTTDHALNVKFKLDKSDDLENWTLIGQHNVLYDLKHQSAMLIKDTIDIHKIHQAKYFRLTFKDNNQFLNSITKIAGIYQQQLQSEPVHWLGVPLTPGRSENEWLFDSRSFSPFFKINIYIHQPGSFYQGTLYSKGPGSNFNLPAINKKLHLKKQLKDILHTKNKTSINSAWQYVQEFNQYHLLTENGSIKSDSIAFPVNKNRLWKIVLKHPLSILPDQMPQMNIAWAPVMMTFLANNNESYQLLVGSNSILPSTLRLPTSISLNSAETVTVDNMTFKPTSRLSAEPSNANLFEGIDWKKILLWLILCISIVIMGIMAYRLYKEMNKSE